MIKQNILKLTTLVGVILFTLGIMMNNSSTATANSEKGINNPSCNGSGIQCVSHIPGWLP